jgi:hypothetical protein
MRSRLPLKIFIISAVMFWGLPGLCGSLQAPPFFLNVPKGHFAGVSSPCKTMSQARKSASFDVVRQILGSIGVEYDQSFAERVSGDVHGQGVRRVVDDRLSGLSHGIVLDVEKNVVKSFWTTDEQGGVINFILVRYPDNLIKKMRRLSLGPSVAASFAGWSGKKAVVRVTEANGVGVTFTSADVHIRKNNRFANAISLFVIRVPAESSKHFSLAFEPAKVCSSSKDVTINLSDQSSVSDYLLGAKLERTVEFFGHDEIGRKVHVKVDF